MVLEGSMNYVMEMLGKAHKETGAENWTNYALGKFREKGREIGAKEQINYALEKFREKGREMGAEEWINYVVGKIKVQLVLLENFGETLIAKLDQLFPPETRAEQLKHWIQVAKRPKTYIIAAAVFLIFGYFRGGSSRGGGTSVKMMVAPGRGYKIPRRSFEDNPKAYFRDLRGK